MSDELTVCYAVTPHPRYRRMAAASAYTAARHNPGIRVRIVEVDPGDYAYGVKPAALPAGGAPPDSWVLFLDADTEVTGPLRLLTAGAAEFNARVGSAWSEGSVRGPQWSALCGHFGLPARPGFNAGVFLCRAHVASTLAESWPRWMRAVREAGLEDPQRRQNKTNWWMLDQYALALAVLEAGWPVAHWTCREHSFAWKGEAPGLIHHHGARRWRSPLR